MASSDTQSLASDLSVPAQEPVEATQEEEAPATESHEPASGQLKGRKKKGQQTTPKKYKLTEEQEAAVLDFLKERPWMYSKAHRDYKDPARRQREWAALGEALGVVGKHLEGWYRTMRTLLGRAKRAKSKSGSGTDLTPSLAAVWEKLSFMTPHLSSLHSRRLGPGKRSAQEALQAEPDLDPDHQGPSEKAPRVVLSSKSGTSNNPAAPLALPALPPPGSSSGSATGGGCCNQVCAQLEQYVRELRSPPDQFWTTIQWRSSHLTPNQLMNMQDEVWEVVLRHIRMSGPKPDPPSHTLTASTSGQVGVEGPLPPQGGLPQVQPPAGTGQTEAQDAGLAAFLQTYEPQARTSSPRKNYIPRRARGPLQPSSTVTSATMHQQATTTQPSQPAAAQLDFDFLDSDPTFFQ